MVSRYQELVSVIVVTCSLLFGLGSTIKFEATPQPFDSSRETQLNITCRIIGPHYWANQVVMIDIGKQGEKPIVSIMDNTNKIQMGPNSEPNMEAEGHIDRDASLSYLTLTINNPTKKGNGAYICKVFYVNEEYDMLEEQATVNVTILEKDILATVEDLMNKVSALQNTTRQQQNLISLQTDQLNFLKDIVQKQKGRLSTQDQQINVLKTIVTKEINIINSKDYDNKAAISKLDHKITEMNESLWFQESFIQQQFTNLEKSVGNTHSLNGSSDYSCAFHLAHNDKELQQKGLLTFTEIKTNLGNCYNSKTGKFTSPVRGIYVFYIMVMTGADDFAHVSLHVNGLQKEELYAGNKDSWYQSSINAVLSLDPGDEVDVFVEDTDGKSTSRGHFAATFSGFLHEAL